MNPIRQVVALADEPCDLCGEIVPQEDVSVEGFEVTGLLVCQSCLEDMLNASTDNARSEVGMVGTGGGRS